MFVCKTVSVEGGQVGKQLDLVCLHTKKITKTILTVQAPILLPLDNC